ncbi:MAG: DMT family transporter [Acidimicrobiales bacterium]
MVIAILAAVAAGGCFAVAGVLQQRAASTRPEDKALSFRLILDLARDRLWLLGIGFAILSYALEALALSFGPLVLVQPLIVCELLFALPISVRWSGKRMSARTWVGTVSVAAGLAVGLACASPGAGRASTSITRWIVALVIVAALATFVVALGRRREGALRASLYAFGAALALGTQAALLKATINRFEHGLPAALESWQLWAMVCAAIAGLLLVQSAFESGPLATSMPVVDAVEPSVAIVFGIALFHEHIRTGFWLLGIAAGLAMLFGGIWLLDTSPLVQYLERAERQQRALGSEAREHGAAPRPTP